MRKLFVVLLGIAFTLSMVSIDADAVTYYTLTVKSSNPSSGVAVAMSPTDRYGRGNGTTQFTRSYAWNTAVALTAPATKDGKFFQKWKKGTSDYSTNQSVSVTMTAGTTMTAVYISDTTAPSGSVNINSGAAATNNTTITLALACSDANGCSQMQFSNDNSTWSAAEAYAATKTWTLASGDGTKSVYAKFSDAAGNWSSASSASISLDTTAPTTTASPAGGTFTGSVVVDLTVDESGTTYYCAGAGCIPAATYAAPLTFTAATTLRYYSADALGNAESIKEATYTPAAYTLNVTSTNDPYGGLALTISPSDLSSRGSGTTSLTRTYTPGTVVTLTAWKWLDNDCEFHKLLKNGMDISSSVSTTNLFHVTTAVAMDNDTNLTMLYRCRLSINNQTTADPDDLYGKNSFPNAQFGGSLYYVQGAHVTVSWQDSPGWACRGLDYWTLLDRFGAPVADFTTPNPVITIEKSGGIKPITKILFNPKVGFASANPDTGVEINFTTPNVGSAPTLGAAFEFTFNCGGTASFSAQAALSDGRTFQKWLKDGQDYYNDSTNQLYPAGASVIAKDNTVLTAVYANAASAPTHDLTVTTSNPASGVSIAVSPKDSTGQRTGTAQFVRTYKQGAVVTLSAPVKAGGNIFKKWQKDGTDYALSQAASVTMDAGTTMTAVYAAPTTAHASLTWDAQNNAASYKICQQCHMDKVNEVYNSLHYQWQGDASKVMSGWTSGFSGGPMLPIQGKIGSAVNAFCINILGNFDGACGSCHVGLGKRPDDAIMTTQQHLDNIDCLICHQKAYKRKKDPTTGTFVPDTAKMSITMDQALQTLHKPERVNCLQCHAKAGGGDAVKRGDLALATGTTADRHYDVHMATTGANLECQACHTPVQHKFPGRGSDLRAIETDITMSCSTSSCHPSKAQAGGHTTPGIERHLNRVACQTCHIPVFAKNASDTAADEATEMNRDWRAPEWSTANNRYEARRDNANDVKPVYQWFGGKSWAYNLGETDYWCQYFNDLMSPLGNDLCAVSFPWPHNWPYFEPITVFDKFKFTPFKFKTAWQPISTWQSFARKELIPLSTKKYFETGDYDAAVKEGNLNRWGYADLPYTTVQTYEYLMLNHQVTPVADAPLTCAACHTIGGVPGAQIDLKAIYNRTSVYGRNADNSCKQCHGPTALPASSLGWPWQVIHSYTKYMLSPELSDDAKCSYCHEFRP